MITQGLVLIEGDNVTEENLGISLGNAKQLITGQAPGFGFILHVAATSPEDLNNALIEFLKVENVTRVVLLMVR